MTKYYTGPDKNIVVVARGKKKKNSVKCYATGRGSTAGFQLVNFGDWPEIVEQSAKNEQEPFFLWTGQSPYFHRTEHLKPKKFHENATELSISEIRVHKNKKLKAEGRSLFLVTLGRCYR